MSDQGLSIFDEPEEIPEGDEQPTQVIEDQDDPVEESPPAKSAKKASTTGKPRTKVPSVDVQDASESAQADEVSASAEVDEPTEDPQPTQQIPATPQTPSPVPDRSGTPVPAPRGTKGSPCRASRPTTATTSSRDPGNTPSAGRL